MLRTLALLVLASCGVVSTSSSCDFPKENPPRCQERLDTVSAEAFKGACKVAMGTESTGKCRTEGRVGGCFLGKQGDGSSVNDWYYAPATRADATMECSRNGTSFLEP